MDRLRRVLAGGTLAIMLGTVVAASGCRNLRNEVPPGPKYSTTGEPSSSVGFNSAPIRTLGLAAPMPIARSPDSPACRVPPVREAPPADGLPAVMGSGGAPSSFGTPPPGSASIGAPTNNAYGGPGTSGAYGTGR